MLSASRLLGGTVETGDALRYGRDSSKGPAHLLHFSADKTPIVVWNITQRCNLHCAHCYANSKDQEYEGELTTEEGHAMLDDLSDFGVPTVLFSGGEPILRDDLLELASAASEKGMRTVLSTNGTKIDDEKASELADAGFSYIGISLDGIGALHDNIRGKAGAFEGALSGIKACQEIGLRTGIRFTVHKKNRAELGDIFELAEEIGVKRLCVYHLAYAGRGEKIKKYFLAPEETREVVEEIFDRTLDACKRDVDLEVLTVDNSVDNVLLYKRVLQEYPERADDVLQMLRWNGGNQSGIAVSCVDPKGNVHPDQFSWHVTAGNVRDKPFSEIWTDADNEVLKPYRQRPRELNGQCSGCSWLDICNGSLRVRAESATGSSEGLDPSCYLTDEEVATPP